MTVQTTSNLTNSIRAQYVAKYWEHLYQNRLYDQLAAPIPGITMTQAMQGSSVVIPYLSGMQPAVTAISQTADLTPQILTDATKSVTATSRADALQWAELVDIQAYTNYGEERVKKLAENQTESVEILAIAAALQGTWVERTAARASLDAGTASHRASDSIFRENQAAMMARKVLGFMDSDGQTNTWAAIMHPYPYHDICESGNVDSIGLYQDQGIHLNFELGKIGPFRLVVSPFAKVHWCAGAANTTAVATTVATQATRLATTIVTAADVSANVGVGQQWLVGTIETGTTTFYPTNEIFEAPSAVTTTLTIIGEAENDGLRFQHEVGETISNADSVYTIVFGGPASLVKLYDAATGEFGSGPIWEETGLVHQFRSVGWKFYGGYGRTSEKLLLRQEVSTSYEA